jgi:hypothetical protein
VILFQRIHINLLSKKKTNTLHEKTVIVTSFLNEIGKNAINFIKSSAKG